MDFDILDGTPDEAAKPTADRSSKEHLPHVKSVGVVRTLTVTQAVEDVPLSPLIDEELHADHPSLTDEETGCPAVEASHPELSINGAEDGEGGLCLTLGGLYLDLDEVERLSDHNLRPPS